MQLLNLCFGRLFCFAHSAAMVALCGRGSSGMVGFAAGGGLTQDTPEGSAMYSSGPSGPYEPNMTLQPNGRTAL